MILPFNAWLPVGKINILLDLQRLKKNPIFRILVDILQNTNFLRAFIASANVPTIYIQHFWNTLAQDVKTGEYSFQLDEQWFILNDDLLRKALEITLRLSLTICGKRSDRLVDEKDEEPQPAPEPQIEDDEYNLQRGVTRSLLVVKGKGKGIATDEQSANIVCDTPSSLDVETNAEAEMSDSKGDTEILNVDEEKGEDVSNTVVLEERTIKLDEGQVGSDSGNTLKSRPPPDEE
ncbi:hypothetical protein Tco_1273944 [Tanacetum coccineum]